MTLESESKSNSNRPKVGRRWINLQVKVALALIVLVLTPLLLSAYLINQIGHVAANFAANDATARQAPMEKALDVYLELIETTKQLHTEIAARLARRPDIAALDPHADLESLVDQEAGLSALAIVAADGTIVVHAERPLPGRRWRAKQVDYPLTNGTLRLSFEVPATLQADYQELKVALDASRQVASISTALPNSYRRAFLALMAGAALLAAVFGVILSTFVTRRIKTLVTVARQVSSGQTDARVALRGRDEMAELGGAFNKMLDDVSASRQQIEYLQRIGAWQDVARRLAHEIKNPLTPIQLAVQQCVSTYAGDNAKFRRLLTDTGEIVEEEIAGLRRLVDTFRTLGQLPKVEAVPISLDEVISELSLDPTMAARLTLQQPAQPITVRADKLLLKRVLANLVENGIHAGQEAKRAGDVVVSWTREDDGGVVINIDDQGKGVAEAQRERIFEPYVTSKATGTGLGLAISKKIALEHGGDLRIADAAAPTGGARFVVTLPAV
jgi:two-component system, NtrC family, nitrogen regulation sensor histidine kinase NtrY